MTDRPAATIWRLWAGREADVMTSSNDPVLVPPGMAPDQGDEALLAAATPGYVHSDASLPNTVSEYPDIDPDNHWSDDGGAWGPSPTPVPSVRIGN